MKKRLSRTACLAASAALLIGCNKGPRPLSGHYSVVGTTAGKLPQIVQRDPVCVHSLLSGFADFDKDGSYTSSFHMEHVCTTRSTPAYDDQGVRYGKYKLNADTIIFYNDVNKVTGKGFRTQGDTILIRGPVHTLFFVKTR